MYHHANRFRPRLTAELNVPHPTFESARAMFPNCEATALRAFVRSEASRLANALIRPVEMPESFSNVVALFADADAVGFSSTRQRRFEFVVMLLKNGRFERRIARRLARQGKLSAEVVL